MMKKSVCLWSVVLGVALFAVGCAQQSEEPASAPAKKEIQESAGLVPMIEVESSSLGQVGYNPESKTLRVLFRKTGAVYDYSDVPAEVFDGLMQAESKGRYLVENVKGHYPFVKE